jgi:hypothetical protein
MSENEEQAMNDDSDLPEPVIDDHRQAMEIVIMAMRMLANVNLPHVRDAAQRALDFGCFQDPTLWIQNHKALEEDKVLLEAAMPLWRAAEKMLKRVKAEREKREAAGGHGIRAPKEPDQ